MTLKIQELFARDPKRDGLANGGQARIRNDRTEQAEGELKAELSSFVCDGQYGRALQQVLFAYLSHLGKDRQVSAWVSGYYGSGKSHLLKMFGHLWQNTKFADGSTARNLVVGLPADVEAHLRELDLAARRASVGCFAAMGQLPAGSSEFVRGTIASIVLAARDLPTQIQLAEFVFWLRDQGIETKVRKAVEAEGKDWLSEVESLNVSPVIARAVCQALPSFAASEADARKAFQAQFAALKADVDSKRFSRIVRLALESDGKLPFAAIVLDEVQQYIGDSVDRAAIVTEAIEVLKTEFGSRLLVIGAGQSALSANTPTLHKLYGRFEVTTSLQDSDVEAVTRKVVLAKKPVHEPAIRGMLDTSAGEVARHLQSCAKLAARAADAQYIVVDYPLLPTRRRFWEECFKAVDAQGHHSQLRSQLKVLHQAVVGASDRTLGHVIPADALYLSIADKLINTGVLLPELYNRIEKLNDDTPRGALRRRVAGLAFLIMKLPRTGAMDLGVRATADVIADLMVEDLTLPSAGFRREIAEVLEGLVADGTLMKVGDEYRLQTAEGAEWDRAFRERLGHLTHQPEEVEMVRAQRFRERAQKALADVKIKHGKTKVARSVALHYDAAPPTGIDGLVIWVRDGWGASEKEVLEAARAGGVDDPTVYVYVPKKEADALRRHLTETLAAQRTLDNKGVPSSNEAHEALQSISSLKMRAESAANEVLEDIFRGARVFKGGGTELTYPTLEESIRKGAEDAVVRRYPRFGDADLAEWSLVIQRAKSGADDNFAPVGHTGPIEEHVVCKEVLRVLGTGNTGNKVRKELNAPPFGWPNDAIDAALIAMHRRGVLKAARNGAAVVPGALDQNNVPTAEFKREQTVVSTEQRIKARGVCALCKCPSKPNEEESKCAEALLALKTLAQRTGGEAPAPEVPNLTLIHELAAKSGAELLVAVAEHADGLKKLWTDWEKLAELRAKRAPAWKQAKELAARATGISEASEHATQLAAIEASRSLLAEPDPVTPIIKALAQLLRQKLSVAHESHERALAGAFTILAADPNWQKLKPEQHALILSTHGLVAPTKPDVGTDEALLVALDARSLEARANLAPLVRTSMASALEEAAKLLTPAARALYLAPATLSTADDVEKWLADRRAQLVEAVKSGPVVVS